MMQPAMQPRINGFFDLVVMEPPDPKESFHMQGHMKITWR
jgi:hypothetical protein